MLRGDLEVMERQCGVGRVRARIWEHHFRATVQGPAGILEACPKGRGMNRLRQSQRRGSDRFVPRCRGIGIFANERFDGKALFVVLKHHVKVA